MGDHNFSTINLGFMVNLRQLNFTYYYQQPGLVFFSLAIPNKVTNFSLMCDFFCGRKSLHILCVFPPQINFDRPKIYLGKNLTHIDRRLCGILAWSLWSMNCSYVYQLLFFVIMLSFKRQVFIPDAGTSRLFKVHFVCLIA